MPQQTLYESTNRDLTSLQIQRPHQTLIGVEPEKPEAYKWFDGRPLTGITMPFGYEGLRKLILDIAANPKKYNLVE